MHKTLQTRCVERAQQGDRSAFQMLVNESMPILYRVVYAMYPNRDEVYDILQDSFVKAYRSLHTLKQPEAWNGWITRIAVNTAKSRLSRRKEWATTPEHYLFENAVSADPEVSERLEQEDAQALLNQALQDLSPEHREVVALVELQEMNCAQAAEVLDCPAGTVRSRLFYARKKLKKILAPYKKQWFSESSDV